MARIVTQEEWLSRAVAAHGDRFDYSRATYVSTYDKVEIGCPLHGYFWQLPSSHTAGRGCPGCKAARIGDIKRGDYSEMIARASEIHGGKYSYPVAQDYKNTDTLILITCPAHGDFKQSMHGHLSGKGCDACGGKVKLDDIEVLSRFTAAHGDRYDYSKVKYDWASRPVEIVCKEHGSFWQIAQDHWAGCGCPACKCCGPSDGENDLATWVASLGVCVERNVRKIIAPRELDIWVSSAQVGIEYHGLYWHTEDRVGDLHEEKARLAEAAGIRLIQVYEDEWSTKKEAVKMVIRNALNLGGDRVMARKCCIVEVDKSVAKEFLDLNHVQGACRARLFIGLEFDGKLVAVMAFNSAVSGRGGYSAETWELARYATSCSVAGGASRLLAEFDRRHPEAPLVSYVDHRYFVGGMYATLGFTKVRTQVDYEYLFRKKRCHKSTLKKSNLKKLLGDRYDDALTERVMADMLGAKRILNAGRTTYVRA